ILASYRDWLALGPGGPPYNFFGFLVQSTSRLLARSDIRAADVVVDEAVVRAYAPHGRTSFLPPSPPLHPRNGPRPAVPAFVAPHRQTSMQGTPEMVGRMEAFLRRLVGEQEEDQPGGGGGRLLEIKPSRLEGGRYPAIFVAEREGKMPPFMGIAKREIVHVHSEGSSHMILSLIDGEEAVAKGWGERHRLSGVNRVLPWGYTLLYAPQNDYEFEVWTRLVVAACRFVTGGKD
ncbi:phospholipase/carboxylesterase, partial [Thermothelomyces heterothallicus CBS 202.75]|uniref:phospholipase/carboxylesterase n=1 Tax=Thermothelomyces heterothallicus CBS 202.75 TaxID=1149848 RepID=UPI003744553C